MDIFSSLDAIEDAIVAFLIHQIFLAPIILLILEEVGVPIPFADFVIAYTGYQVAVGRIPYVEAFALLLIADFIGATILYFVARRYGKTIINKFGKYIDLDMNKLDLFEGFFRKYGPIAIIIGRHIYGFKVPITLFSGISKMPYRVFLLGIAISDSFWIPFYLAIGKRLGPKTVHLLHIYHVDHAYYSLLIIPVILAFLPFFLMRKNNAKKSD